MHPLAKLDHRYLWHPFTQMRDWLKREPIVITGGKGALLQDVYGRKYLDANASIWTNLHGHNNPKINAAIRRQLAKIAHSSALGLANEPASLLAEKLVEMANPKTLKGRFSAPSGACVFKSSSTLARGQNATPSHRHLAKVFFSDDGSTALEVALKLAYEFARRCGRSPKPRFLSLEGAYHGDTIGAVSLGHIDLFHRAYSGLLFKTDKTEAPYCYRCRFNRATPERGDARDYRRCRWECLERLEARFKKQSAKGNAYAGFVFEPLMQGAAGMVAQPAGWLRQAATIARNYGALLLADEVMTGFGRTGIPERYRRSPAPTVFACHAEDVQPDFLALAKGLSGGYLPMAATLTTEQVFEAFLGEYEEFRTFFHGHSFTGNQLGAAAALASADLLKSPACVQARKDLERALESGLRALWRFPVVGDIRQVGLVVGVELVQNWRTREPFPLPARAGIRVCEAMARRGVLTRPVGNVIVLMPPYCSTLDQVVQMVSALRFGIEDTFPGTQNTF